MTTIKTNRGNFFEEFDVGRVIVHATPRTVTEGDVALYTALYGTRFAVHSADTFAMDMGFEAAPVDDFLVFHLVFGKSVPDVSLNAIANLGYAEGRFVSPVFPGDTLSAESQVIGLRENQNGKSGIVYVRTRGLNQTGDTVLEFARWVMVNKRDPASPAPTTVVPELASAVDAADLIVPSGLDLTGYDTALAGATNLWDDYAVGERIDHVDGMTVEEAEHMLATRLYQNTAKVHFNALAQTDSRFGRRLIYGGHVISLARALSFNGLANAFHVAAINGGAHTAPLFAGDTVHAWSEVLDKVPIDEREDVAALRLRTVATKNHPCDAFPYKDEEAAYDTSVILDFDYWVLMPRRP